MASEHTVRTATFDVLRRLELTTIFSNPGSTEVPFLAGLPEDLRFVLALHEGSVVAMAAGYAIARGAPSLALLHSTPGLGNAVAALATARQPRAARRRGRPAGPPPPRARAVPGRAPARARGRLPGLGRPARARPGRARRDRPRLPRGRHRPRPGDRDRPDGRLAAPGPEPHEILGPARLLRRPPPTRRPSTRSRTCSPAPSGRRSSSGPAPTAPSAGRRSSSLRSASAARSGRSRSGARPAFRRTIRASPGTCPPGGRGCARCSPPTTPSSSWGRAPSASTPTTRAAGRAGHPDRGRDPGPRRGAPQPGGARRARRAGRDLRRWRRRRRRARPRRARARPPGAPPRRPRPASRCAPATCSPRSPSACRATRS